MRSPLSIEALRAEVTSARAWATPSVARRVEAELGIELSEPGSLDRSDTTLIAFGGGTLIDRAKVAAKGRPDPIRIIAVPTVWGSGAQVSPIVVHDEGGHKSFDIDGRFVPDAWVLWPELASSLPEDLVLDACADTWAHALEAFGSPLASPNVRADAAAVLARLGDLGPSEYAAWFEAGAAACVAQATSSTGLVHGIAHALEAPLRRHSPEREWSHARVCRAFVRAVFRFNLAASGKLAKLLREHGLDPDALDAHLGRLDGDPLATAASEVLVSEWAAVLREPPTRTNVALVRRDDVAEILRMVSK